MPLGDAIARAGHTAVPVKTTAAAGVRVDGEYERTAASGTAFACLLLLPSAGSEPVVPRGRRTVKEPTVLYEPYDDTGAPIELSATDELLITAPELTGPDPVRWQLTAPPLPFARPGFLIGYQAQLKRVDD